MGRRKIEIKAIKDDRNRSVTFLKRKGGLFKKAHELSVLCSVDVAVFVFGNNKKLYEYSSADMRDLITKYQYHGGPSETKGPSDFNGGNDDDDDDEGDASPPQGPDGLDAHMMPPQYHGQQPNFSQLRHHTPSVSPPMPNGHFQSQPHHYQPRGHTPQPPVGSRPGSRNDGRRMGPNMVNQQGPHPGITYMPTPPIYNPGQNQQNLMHPQGPQYPYPHPQQQPQQQPQQPQQPQAPQPYMDDRQAVGLGYSQAPPQQPITITRTHPSPPQPSHTQTHPQPVAQISTPPQPERRQTDPQRPPPVEPKTEQPDRPQRPLLNTDAAVTKLPQRRGHSIFTPIESNNDSILSQHLASFHTPDPATKVEPGTAAAALGRPHSTELNRAGSSTNSSPPPPQPQRSDTHSSIPETTFTPPSRSNTGGAGARPRGPRLTVQIPADGEEPGSAGGDSNSPRNPSEATSHTAQRQNSVVLPPPSPSASALLSAGATGPPNPFARPVPHQNVNGDTPASALPSRFLGTEFLPSPSSFYNEWSFRGGDNNTLPSPLNFATPVAGSGPSFLRDDPMSNASSGAPLNSLTATAGVTGKRKSPDLSDHDQHHDEIMEGATETVKRVKVN